MIRVLSVAAIRRVTRTRRGRMPILAWTLLTLVLAFVTRTLGRSGGASHLLVGHVAQAIVPLAAYGVVSAVFEGGGMRTSARGICALGASPRDAALSSVLVAIGGSALFVGGLAALVCVIAHGPTDGPLGHDLPVTIGVALLSGAAYAAFFCAGSAGGGGMRSVLLVLDFLLGAPGGAGALLVPRGHVISLFGGPLCFDLSRRASSVSLLVLLVVAALFAVGVGRRAR